MTTLDRTASGRPEPSEHLDYYGKYIALVPGNDAIEAIERQWDETIALLRTIPESKGDHRYGPDKWTIKEVLGHVIYGERIFTHRALRFARKDTTPLPGFDENLYVPAGNFGRRTMADLIDEWTAVRRSTLALLRGFDPEAWLRTGTANGALISVRALAFIVAGHGAHHMRLLNERYLRPTG